MKSGIYQIRNTEDGKVYIGSTVNFRKRKNQHYSKLKIGKHHNRKLQRAWSKYGEEAFKFEEMFHCEVKYILFMENIFIGGNDAVNSGYNIAPKAGHTLGYKHTVEDRALISKLRTGVKLSPEHKAKISKASREYWTPENCMKKSDFRRGQKHSEETKAKIGASKIGKPRSDELKAKLSAYRKGRKLSESHKAAISEGNRRRAARERAMRA